MFYTRKIGWLFILLFFVSCSAANGLHEEPVKSVSDPVKVTICQLQNDPAAYNHKLIEVTGFASHGFEDFALFDPSCSSRNSVWLEYGGTAASGTMYCCGVTAARSRSEQLTVEDISVPLVDDEHFQQFDKLLQHAPDSIVHATIVGRFFSGKQVEYPTGESWGGFGHMGCCSLLAIQQVIAVDPQDRDDLDYRASADQPDTKAGCGYKFLTPLQPSGGLIEAQQRAELGQSDWSFSDPQRVATDTLAHLLNVDEKSITGIKEMRKAQGRLIYQWHHKAKGEGYMVVVSRPYWLSLYAKDPKRIAWVVVAAYESFCTGIR